MKTALGEGDKNKGLKDSIKVEEVRRLGQRGIGNRPRLVKLKIVNAETRKLVLKNSYEELKKVNKNLPNKDKVYINKDYSYAESHRKQKQTRMTGSSGQER